jgi:ATP phosphoribosyltransferase regulatory subunit
MQPSFLPSGSRDLLPIDLVRQENIRHLLLNLFKSWGYQPVLPPTLESIEFLDKARPQFIKEAFKVIDNDSQLLALRPDLTLPIARLAATRLSAVERPLRLCYTAKVFKQNTHFADQRREIYQAGIELIGSREGEEVYSLEQANKANLECLSVLIESLEKAGLKDYKIVLSHTDLWRYAGEILHRVEEFLEIDISLDFDALLASGDFVEYQKAVLKAEERCRKALKNSKEDSELKTIFSKDSGETPLNYLRKACFELTGSPEKVLSYLDSDSPLYKELSTIIALEEIFGKNKFIIDFTLRPDPNYYTGLYFEVVLPECGKPIGKGGRYNNLMACFGSSEPAIGFSLQIDYLIKYSKNEELTLDDSKRKTASVKFTGNSTESYLASLEQAKELRSKHPVVILE